MTLGSSISCIISPIYEGRKLALKEINEALGKMNHELIQRVFSTSRIVIPEQNLSEGMLLLVLQIEITEKARQYWTDGLL